MNYFQEQLKNLLICSQILNWFSKNFGTISYWGLRRLNRNCENRKWEEIFVRVKNKTEKKFEIFY